MKFTTGHRAALFGAASIFALAGAQAAHAQDATAGTPGATVPTTNPSANDATAAPSDEIIITGVRASQERSIDIKRRSAEIVDAIVAEDIGKLPDVTIADSLQRVPGIQISRSAGEGGRVVIRGAPQVLGTLNGERFIMSESILNSEANFTDIPASLVSGVVVYKSQNASVTDGGIGGVIDLQTLRALTLKDGFTFNARAEAGRGSLVDGTDWRIEGLAGYNWGDRIAMGLSASYSDSTSASSFQSIEPDYVDEYSTWFGTPAGDLNGDGDTNDQYIIPMGWNTFVNSRQFERKRLGVAYNFNAQLSDAFSVVGDVFYTKMDERQHGQQLFVNGNFGGRNSLLEFSNRAGRPPSVVNSIEFNDVDVGGNGSFTNQYLVTEFNGLTNGLRGGVQSVFRETDSLNTNLELRYNPGGRFKGSIRWVRGTGDRTQRALTVAQQTDSRAIPRTAGGAPVDLNPGSIPTTPTNPINVSMGRNSFGFNISDQLATAAANPAAWYLHSNWLERNKTSADLNVFRADGSWEATDALSFDFGLRHSVRDMHEAREDYFSPSGFGNLYQKYSEAGYAIAAAGQTYDPLPVYGLDNPALAGFVTNVSDFGPVRGLDVTLPMIDTRALNKPEAWRDSLFGAGKYIAAPDRTYGVKETQRSAYLKANFEFPLGATTRFFGNVGGRLVKSKVRVFQNETDGTQLNRTEILSGGDPNHGAYIDLGDIYTTNTRTKLLPSANLNLDFDNKFRFKAAYSATQALQALENLARGEITFYNGPDFIAGETFQRVSSVQRLGNPDLDPWFAKSISLAAEWYPRRNAIISLGVFRTKVAAYNYQATAQIDAPDSDGVVRRGATLLTIEQGEGASYKGVEFGYQQTYDFLPGFLSHFGSNINYTFSPSQAGKNAATGATLRLADGSTAPFNNTAKHQVNAVLWYEDDRFQARIAANYMSKTYQGAFSHWTFASPAGTEGLGSFMDATTYIDFGASYDVTDNFQVFLNGSNLTEEAPKNYVGSKAFRAASFGNNGYNQFERVISAGIRARF
jgi:TonB-dependent receptor